MIRTPVPATKPDCFGTGYELTHVMCQPCPVKRTCTSQRDQWAGVPSLAEAAANPPPEPLDSTPDDPEAIYAAIFQKHYGYDPFVSRTAKHRVRIEKAKQSIAKGAAICAEQDLDFALFVTAQMHAFRVAQQNTLRKMKYFPANWLSGPGAATRYQIHGAKAQRQFRRVRADAFDHHTAWGLLRTTLLDDEEDIAGLYCTTRRLGGTETYAEIVAQSGPSIEWAAVTSLGTDVPSAVRTHYWQLHRRFGADTLRDLKQHVRLRAAFALAAQVRHGLADRVHLHDGWTWEDFAALMVSIGGPLRRTRPTHTPDGLAHLGGKLWGAHR